MCIKHWGHVYSEICSVYCNHLILQPLSVCISAVSLIPTKSLICEWVNRASESVPHYSDISQLINTVLNTIPVLLKPTFSFFHLSVPCHVISQTHQFSFYEFVYIWMKNYQKYKFEFHLLQCSVCLSFWWLVMRLSDRQECLDLCVCSWQNYTWHIKHSTVQWHIGLGITASTGKPLYPHTKCNFNAINQIREMLSALWVFLTLEA